jgi:hypothetical protein
MPNDPLPSPDRADEPSHEPRQDADYDAVHAALTSTTHGRSFLTEYVSRHRPPDEIQKLVATIVRLEATLRDNPSVPASTVPSRAIADLIATIREIESVLTASASSAPDVHFAVERIQDIAMALRQREVDAALCDGLEAALREVGDAIVRNEAAAANAASAAALLRDLARRVDGMMAGTRTVVSSAADAEWLDDTVQESVADLGEAHAPRSDAVQSPVQFEQMRTVLPETEATAAPPEHSGDPLEPLSLPIPSPIEGRGQEPQARADDLPEAPASAGANPISRAALNDPLAALQALSEEELIALFS